MRFRETIGPVFYGFALYNREYFVFSKTVLDTQHISTFIVGLIIIFFLQILDQIGLYWTYFLCV